MKKLSQMYEKEDVILDMAKEDYLMFSSKNDIKDLDIDSISRIAEQRSPFESKSEKSKIFIKGFIDMHEKSKQKEEEKTSFNLSQYKEAKKKKKYKYNPWAVCTNSVGRDDKKKYEKCVKEVKKQSDTSKFIKLSSLNDIIYIDSLENFNNSLNYVNSVKIANKEIDSNLNNINNNWEYIYNTIINVPVGQKIASGNIRTRVENIDNAISILGGSLTYLAGHLENEMQNKVVNNLIAKLRNLIADWRSIRERIVEETRIKMFAKTSQVGIDDQVGKKNTVWLSAYFSHSIDDYKSFYKIAQSVVQKVKQNLGIDGIYNDLSAPDADVESIDFKYETRIVSDSRWINEVLKEEIEEIFNNELKNINTNIRVSVEVQDPRYDDDYESLMVHDNDHYYDIEKNAKNNYLGEKEYSSYSSWLKAVKSNGAERIEGDKDIAHAFDKEGKGVGEWDGEKGTISKK